MKASFCERARQQICILQVSFLGRRTTSGYAREHQHELLAKRFQAPAPLQEKSGNKLLQVRGNAGTHDLQLGEDTLQALQGAASADAEVAVPRYDKSAYKGCGDRAPRSSWPRVQGPIDVILFEGWMLGFSPVAEEQVAKVQ